MGDKTVAEQQKELLQKLPGVISAEICRDGDRLSEIHILATSERGAKQISRDVQSAMMARFALEIDHRIISVAQISREVGERLAVARIEHRELDISYRGGECRVSVKLACAGKEFEASAEGDMTLRGRMNAAASAAAAALNECFAGRAEVVAEEVRTADIGGGSAVIAAVRLKIGSSSERLIGACPTGDEPVLSAVRATLDALNRRLSIL